MRYLLVLILGALIGAGVAFYFFVGAPRARQAQLGATPLKAPEAGGDPPGTAVLTLDEQFFDALLTTIFRDLNPPAFQLQQLGGATHEGTPGGVRFVNAQGGCVSRVVVEQQNAGARTGVKLQNNQVVAPLAFSGSYSVPLAGCVNFRGAAESDIQLSFNQNEQTLYGQINVRGVNLEGVSPLASPFVTGFVQNAINQRVNPIVLMRAQQLTLNVPVQASGGTLRAQAKDVRAEIKDGALRLHVTYDFAGTRGAGNAPPPPPPG